MGWTVWGSNFGVGDILHTSPDWPGAHSASFSVRVSPFPGVKRPGRGADHPPPTGVEVKEKVKLYLYSPSGPPWLF